METMRCYFMRDGHIAAIKLLDPSPDEHAIVYALALIRVRDDECDGVEVWDRERMVFQYPPTVSERRNIAG
jgi:hypothetical protein